ncbi:hypothetical protein [Streptomyces sp. NPDC012888]|uniref:hypothetical protein n=1 Tax=Streptomyces sp. NPDC012888 TaxID=3364855 RepID=UPI0036B3EA96
MLRFAVRASLPVLLALSVLVGCGAPAGGTAGADVRRAVADWAAGGSGRPAGVPLESWAYEVTSVRVDPGGARATAAAELRYRLAGYDTGPAAGARELSLAAEDGRWRVLADRPAPGAPPQLWDQGPVSVVRGDRVLVLGTRPEPELRAVAATADGAAPAVSAAWPEGRPGRAVVLVPGSADRMAELLGAPAPAYRGTVAVTTGRVGAAPLPADRVVVNPEAYAGLAEPGRQVVLAHELTHVATRTATSARTPQWLSEGFADWAAYRGRAHTPAQAAPALARAVRGGRVPDALPADRDFTPGGDQEAVSRAYEGSWLACRLIADRWGEQALRELYRAAAREPLPEALSRTLGTDPAALTAAWRSALRADLA